jgi:hypothetical protein
MLYNTLQKFKAPAIVDFGGYQALLDDSQYGCDLPRLDHLSTVAGEECFEELHETRDATLLLPACGRQEEGEEGAIFGWHTSVVSL